MLWGSLIKIWNLAKHLRNKTMNIKMLKSIGKKLKATGLKGLILFVSFFHMICKITNFDIWTAKHLAEASCTELTWLFPNWWSKGIIFEFNNTCKQLQNIFCDVFKQISHIALSISMQKCAKNCSFYVMKVQKKIPKIVTFNA